VVADVALDPVANKLIAATHGRGMYLAPMLSARTTRTLAVTKAGEGDGTVASAPAGIDCGSTCVYDFDSGTPVTLTAVPASGSEFAGWSGDCSGAGQCSLTMDADHPVTATFEPASPTEILSVDRVGDGTGTVTSSPAGIDCGATCTHAFDRGTQVTVTAVPGAGSSFTGWTGDCSGTGTCTLTMTTGHAVGAIFDADKTLTVAKTGTGGGLVTSTPAGIDCGSTCAHAFAHGASVTLTAQGDSTSTFAGWSGACSGAGACTVTMDAARSATAEFVRNSGPPPPPPPPAPPPPPPPPPRARCVVPRVKGKTLAAAKRRIRVAHCSVGSIKRTYSRTRKGLVISQKPAPGKKLAAGAKVRLVVSKGKKKR